MEHKYLIHNKFEVKSVSAKSGELLQEAVGYNVVLDTYIKERLGLANTNSVLTEIMYGTGSGTPAVTDTALFTYKGSMRAETIETVYAYPTSHITKRITLDIDTYGYNITEVGFGEVNYGSASASHLVTHAMLQDSEGHQIAIEKTDTNIVYINATFYVTWSSGDAFGANGLYPRAENNVFIKYLLGQADSFNVRFTRLPCQTAEELNSCYLASKTLYFKNSKGNLSNMTLTLPTASFSASECARNVVTHFGCPELGVFSYPNDDFSYTITGMELGTGDGQTKDFNIQIPSDIIRPGSLKIYVDGVEQREGIDYSTEFPNNCIDSYEGYISSYQGYSAYDSEHRKCGSLQKRSSGYSYYDPFIWRNKTASDIYPTSCTVNEQNPIWLDFDSEAKINKLKLRYDVPAAYADYLKIQYSYDNDNWHDVSYTRNEWSYTWQAITARFWRLWFTKDGSESYNWTFKLYSSNSEIEEGTNFATSVFLGYVDPGLHFKAAPGAGKAISLDAVLSKPYKTPNNILRYSVTLQLGRG